MLKRNVSVAVAAALALSLAACGSSPASSAASSEAAPSEAISSEAASSEATAAPAAGDFDVDQDITVISREDGSGTRSAFEEILGIQDKCAYLNEYSSTGDVIGNVASNPNAIGYASLSAVDETVSAVSVDGVAPTEATVADGSFPIQRPFVIVTVEGTELSEAAQAFLDYAMSADVADIIAAAGAVSANG